MKRKLLCSLIAGLGLALGAGAQAEISNGVVKIGVLADMSALTVTFQVRDLSLPPRWLPTTMSSRRAPN